MNEMTTPGMILNVLKPVTKARLVIFLLVTMLTSTAQAQWNTQSPVPTNLDVRGFTATADYNSDDDLDDK